MKEVKQNYSAWTIEKDQFPKGASFQEQLKFLINYAVLAPSGHNAQPWKFRVGSNTIELLFDAARTLPKSDADHRQTIISLGCALENFLIAADYFGFGCEVEYFPKSQKEIVARIECRQMKVSEIQTDHLFNYIKRRWTDRNKYLTIIPEKEKINSLQDVVFADIQLNFIEQGHEKKKNMVADKVVQAGIAAMQSDGFRDELSQYVKPNNTTSSVGMPGNTLGVPTLMSFLLPSMIKRFNVAKLNKTKDTSLLKNHTPIFGIISTKDDSKEMWIRAGQCFERVFLEACRQGLHVAPLAAVVQIGEYYKNLQHILRTPLRPQVFFRMGYSTEEPLHSPRMMALEVLENLI